MAPRRVISQTTPDTESGKQSHNTNQTTQTLCCPLSHVIFLPAGTSSTENSCFFKGEPFPKREDPVAISPNFPFEVGLKGNRKRKGNRPFWGSDLHGTLFDKPTTLSLWVKTGFELCVALITPDETKLACFLFVQLWLVFHFHLCPASRVPAAAGRAFQEPHAKHAA